MKKRVGIVGYGNLGKYLAKNILQNDKVASRFELAFVWNRSPEKVKQDSLIPQEIILENLEDFPKMKADIIVEVAHPLITKKFGVEFLKHADFFCGSPTIFAEQEVEDQIRQASEKYRHGVYIPSGALWGAPDIEKMADLGTLTSLRITMKKHPLSLKVEPELMKKLTEYINSSNDDECIIYEGSVRKLCPLAPNNVNTMACAALAGHNLGFDKVQARLIADKKLTAHVIDIEIEGPKMGEEVFKISTTRYNPAVTGAVTGSSTYDSFLSSLLKSGNQGKGIHFC